MSQRLGIFTIMSTVTGVVIFTAICSLIFFVTNSYLLKISVDLRTIQEKIDVVDITHLVKKCITDDGIIDSSSLTKGDILDFTSSSPLCPRDTYIRITDRETGNSWEFGKEGKYSHEIFIPLKVGENIHLATLYVSL